MNVLVNNEQGYGLYVDGKLTATFSRNESMKHISSQIEKRGNEEYTEKKMRGKSFPETVSAQDKAKVKKAEPKEEAKEEPDAS